jgi:ATP-binding cassette subfamily B protein
MPLMKLAAGAGTLMVLWYGGLQVIARRIGLGDLVAFIGYLNLLAWPTMALGWMLSIVQRGRAAHAAPRAHLRRRRRSPTARRRTAAGRCAARVEFAT